MDRREVLKLSGIVLGYSLAGGLTIAGIQGCNRDNKSDWTPESLDASQAELLAEVCDTIIPASDTPGAKDALCHRYIDELITNFYSKEDRDQFIKDLKIFDDYSIRKYSKAFVALIPAERESVLNMIVDDISKEHEKNKLKKGVKKHVFTAIKEATIAGYFTSEAGAKGGLGSFIPVPGPYKGCIDYADIGKVYVL
jgi:hypothetical protein